MKSDCLIENKKRREGLCVRLENSITTHGKGFLQPPRSLDDATPEGGHGVMFNHLGATFIEKVLGFQTIASLSSSLATTISFVDDDLSLDKLAAGGTI